MATMQHTDGGGTHGPVRSSISVDPGEIRSFAKFLQEMETELKLARTELVRNRGRAERGFGTFHRADAAVHKHDTALEAEIKQLDALIARFGELTEGTVQMSRTYTDLEELNRATTSQVTAHLAAGAQS